MSTANSTAANAQTGNSRRRLCSICQTARAIIKIPSTLSPSCQSCFFDYFESTVHNTISSSGIFKSGQKVAIAASGGKDSTVLAYVLEKLNREKGYGLDLVLLSIDEGITGYRDDSLEVAHLLFVECGHDLFDHC